MEFFDGEKCETGKYGKIMTLAYESMLLHEHSSMKLWASTTNCWIWHRSLYAFFAMYNKFDSYKLFSSMKKQANK